MVCKSSNLRVIIKPSPRKESALYQLLFIFKKELQAVREADNNLDTFQIVPILVFKPKFIIGTIQLFVTLHYRRPVFIILINKKLSSHQRKEAIQKTENRSDDHTSQLITFNKS